MQSVFKFSYVLFALRWTPIGEALGQVDIFVRSLGQADLWSDLPPSMIRLQVRLTFFVRSVCQADLWSDVPPVIKLWVRLTFFVKSLGQTDLWSDVLP